MNMNLRCCNNIQSLGSLRKTVLFLKVIADENRLKILCMLKKGERCVCDIWKLLKLPQNLTSHHLKVLKGLGLVNDRKNGLNVYYSINKKQMSKLNVLLNKFLSSYEK